MQSFCDIFGKCATILIILSLLQNCRRRYYITHHLTSNLLPPYLANFECTTAQLYNDRYPFNSVTNRLFKQ